MESRGLSEGASLGWIGILFLVSMLCVTWTQVARFRSGAINSTSCTHPMFLSTFKTCKARWKKSTGFADLEDSFAFWLPMAILPLTELILTIGTTSMNTLLGSGLLNAPLACRLVNTVSPARRTITGDWLGPTILCRKWTSGVCAWNCSIFDVCVGCHVAFCGDYGSTALISVIALSII